MSSKLANKLQYEAKQKQLLSLVELEARRLQGVQEGVASGEREIRELIERKATLSRTIATMEGELKGMREEKEKMAQEKADLDIFKEFLNKLLAKLGSYKQAVDETVKYANENLKEHGVPMTFGLAPGEIVEINFDNFDKYE